MTNIEASPIFNAGPLQLSGRDPEVPAPPNDTVFFTAVPPSIIGGSPRTLPSGADEAGVTAVKFYELRDILRGKMARVTEADDLAVVEVVVLAEQCDASGGGPEVDVTE